MPGGESLIAVRVDAGNAVTGIGEIDGQTFREGGFARRPPFELATTQDRASYRPRPPNSPLKGLGAFYPVEGRTGKGPMRAQRVFPTATTRRMRRRIWVSLPTRRRSI